MIKEKRVKEVFEERNFYREKCEKSLKFINLEIEKIKNTRAKYIKIGKMNNLELLISDYHLEFLNKVKRELK